MRNFFRALGQKFGTGNAPSSEEPILLHAFDGTEATEVDVLRHVYRHIAEAIRPGITTARIEQVVAAVLDQTGAEGYFKGYRGFPNFTTVSLNEEVLMTPPSGRVLKEGDLVKIQTGVKWGGRHAFIGWTFGAGRISEVRRKLITAGLEALQAGMMAVHDGALVHDLTSAMDQAIQQAGYSPNADFVGYRIGEKANMPPMIPCALRGKSQATVTRGMTLVLIVIAHQGRAECVVADDGWTVVAKDRRDSVMFSRLVRVEEGGCRLLSDFPALECAWPPAAGLL